MCDGRCRLRREREEKHIPNVFGEDSPSSPTRTIDTRRRDGVCILSLFLTRPTHLRTQHPVLLRREGLYLVMALDTEAQRGSLTRSIGKESRLEVSILSLEKLTLETGERDTHSKVEFLTSIDGKGLVLIWGSQRAHGAVYVWGRDGAELGAVYTFISPFRHVLNSVFHHFETDILSFSVTVEPEDQGVGSFRLLSEMPTDGPLLVRGNLPDVGVEELFRGRLVP